MFWVRLDGERRKRPIEVLLAVACRNDYTHGQLWLGAGWNDRVPPLRSDDDSIDPEGAESYRLYTHAAVLYRKSGVGVRLVVVDVDDRPVLNPSISWRDAARLSPEALRNVARSFRAYEMPRTGLEGPAGVPWAPPGGLPAVTMGAAEVEALLDLDRARAHAAVSISPTGFRSPVECARAIVRLARAGIPVLGPELPASVRVLLADDLVAVLDRVRRPESGGGDVDSIWRNVPLSLAIRRRAHWSHGTTVGRPHDFPCVCLVVEQDGKIDEADIELQSWPYVEVVGTDRESTAQKAVSSASGRAADILVRVGQPLALGPHFVRDIVAAFELGRSDVVLIPPSLQYVKATGRLMGALSAEGNHSISRPVAIAQWLPTQRRPRPFVAHGMEVVAKVEDESKLQFPQDGALRVIGHTPTPLSWVEPRRLADSQT